MDQFVKNYEIEGKIGEGGMATVFLAKHLKLNKPVAIKVLNKELVVNKNIRHRFISEARNMFSMNHPNVVKVIDLIEEDETIAFVMEYIEGKTLRQLIESNAQMVVAELKNYFNQMLDALAYVHKSQMIHRDIKPSNFMLTKDGIIKLLDFGIAKISDDSQVDYTVTSTNQSMGTPMYMSPEQINDSGSVTQVSDVYSMGVILWEMITGKKPYESRTLSTFQLQTKIVTEQLLPTGTVFDQIIQKATAKEPGKRYLSIIQMKEHFNRVFKLSQEEEKTVFAPQHGELIKSVKSQYGHGRSRKYINWLVPAALVIIGAALFFFLRKNNNQVLSNNQTSEINTPNPTKKEQETSSADPSRPDDHPETQHINVNGDDRNETVSYLDENGKLIYVSDCYVIVTGAYAYESDCKSWVAAENEIGSFKAGYLWIPDYPSLSGKRNFATFYGPYQTLSECKEQMRYLPKDEKFYYAKKVSMTPMVQQEIR